MTSPFLPLRLQRGLLSTASMHLPKPDANLHEKFPYLHMFVQVHILDHAEKGRGWPQKTSLLKMPRKSAEKALSAVKAQSVTLPAREEQRGTGASGPSAGRGRAVLLRGGPQPALEALYQGLAILVCLLVVPESPDLLVGESVYSL